MFQPKKEIEIKDLNIHNQILEDGDDYTSELDKFYFAPEEINEVEVSENDLIGLTYIGGYICFKVLKKISVPCVMII